MILALVASTVALVCLCPRSSSGEMFFTIDCVSVTKTER